MSGIGGGYRAVDGLCRRSDAGRDTDRASGARLQGRSWRTDAQPAGRRERPSDDDEADHATAGRRADDHGTRWWFDHYGTAYDATANDGLAEPAANGHVVADGHADPHRHVHTVMQSAVRRGNGVA